MNLSKEQVERKTDDVLRFIVGYFDENGFAPSYREICAGAEIRSTASVKSYIYKLEKRGYIVFKDGPRKIAILDKGREKVISDEATS